MSGLSRRGEIRDPIRRRDYYRTRLPIHKVAWPSKVIILETDLPGSLPHLARALPIFRLPPGRNAASYPPLGYKGLPLPGMLATRPAQEPGPARMWRDAAAAGPGCVILSPERDKIVTVLQAKSYNFAQNIIKD